MAGYERLRRSSDFTRIMNEGRLLKGSMLLIRLAPGLEGITRIGYAVSKRNGNAVRRNRIKRLFRAAARLQETLPASTDMVLVPRAGMLAEGIKAQDVAAELGRLLSAKGRGAR